MWNNQLSTVNSKKLIGYAQSHGINSLIPDAYLYGTPTGDNFLPPKINVVYIKPAGPV
jgi:hypothetical protein